MKDKIVIALVSFLVVTKSIAQNNQAAPALRFSGYIETYYQYDFNKTLQNTRPNFVYSHNRNNEFAVNLAFAKANYNTEKVRANFALMTGTYAQANLAAEDIGLRNIYEANMGFKIAKNKNIWVDAGIFSSHIGFESAIGKDCYTLSRSILADNTPYYEAGIKISYTSNNQKLFASALLLNGWQRIKKVDGNTTPAFGTQITYKPTEKVTLNYSTFIGNDKPDSVRQMRYFNNLYSIVQLSKKWNAIVGFDYGFEQKSKGSSQFNNWFSPVIILKYAPTDKISIAARTEYYKDKKGVIIKTNSINGFNNWGFSCNLDYAISSNIMWRIEVKNYTSKDKIFNASNNMLSTSNTAISAVLAISF